MIILLLLLAAEVLVLIFVHPGPHHLDWLLELSLFCLFWTLAWIGEKMIHAHFVGSGLLKELGALALVGIGIWFVVCIPYL